MIHTRMQRVGSPYEENFKEITVRKPRVESKIRMRSKERRKLLRRRRRRRKKEEIDFSHGAAAA